MAIGIRKHPHPSQTRFYIAKYTPHKFTVINVTPTPSSRKRIARLMKSLQIAKEKTHTVLLPLN